MGPDVCDKGHHGFMRKFEKNGQEWYSCTFKYQDGKTCWGKVPKDAPAYDEQINTEWRTPPKSNVAVPNPTILGDALKVAWEIVVLTFGDTLNGTGDLQIAKLVRRLALILQTGEEPLEDWKPAMSREDKLAQIAELKRQMEQVGVME